MVKAHGAGQAEGLFCLRVRMAAANQFEGHIVNRLRVDGDAADPVAIDHLQPLTRHAVGAACFHGRLTAGVDQRFRGLKDSVQLHGVEGRRRAAAHVERAGTQLLFSDQPDHRGDLSFQRPGIGIKQLSVPYLRADKAAVTASAFAKRNADIEIDLVITGLLKRLLGFHRHPQQ